MIAEPRSSIRVMLFDLDDCLMAHSRAVAIGLTRARTEAGGAVAAADDADELRRWRDLEEHHYGRWLRGEIDFIEQRRERARGFLAPFGIVPTPDEALAWFDRYMVGYRASWALFDDVLPALDALEKAVPGIRFGVITNGDLTFQSEKLTAIGLADRMEHVIASGEVGVAKPAAAIFELAAATFGVGVASCAYVGDRLRTDAAGADAAGMLGLWLDRPLEALGVPVEAGIVPPGVARLATLRDLPAAVAAH
ncbi:HAD-IA family hydrolase [Microcella alkalica]|uniref:Putative hydrolase of the HAD superfamily n=1 Tax=Microcella alkalica TaxID=355930 RepID=A0A839EDH3_9MICO|nr:putative hydrolase of the HAD superfamily [Microcella alkalica]